jgi:ferrochelatase
MCRSPTSNRRSSGSRADGSPGGRPVQSGGPDGPADVRPFLQNLFSDPAIIGLPGFLRLPLARLISTRRERSAQANYDLMGGGSPLLPETFKQAGALQDVLTGTAGDEVRVFIAMRYWRPLTEDTAQEVAAYQPDDVVLLPLYPQYLDHHDGVIAEAWAEVYDGVGYRPYGLLLSRSDGWIEAQVDRHARRNWPRPATGPCGSCFRPTASLKA